MNDYEQNRDMWTTNAMIYYGGGFVRDLGLLWRLADPDNQRRLKEAFPEYWEKYEKLGDIQKGKQ